MFNIFKWYAARKKKQAENAENTQLWFTRRGDVVRIIDMHDAHLYNTIFYLWKRYGELHGANDGKGPWDVLEWKYNALLNEADRRGLKFGYSPTRYPREDKLGSIIEIMPVT